MKVLMILGLISFFSIATAGDFPGELDFSGWLFAEYGSGDRYPEAKGEDRLGVSQAGLLAKAHFENVTAVLLIGGEVMTDASNANGDVGIKDAFLIWDKIGDSNFSLSVGAQPLFFGLKAAGYSADHSIRGSLEFGGAGGFAVSRQAGAAMVFHYTTGFGKISAGLFDTSSSTADYIDAGGLGSIDGSSLDKNHFVQAKFQNLGVEGLYGFLGFESRYIGGAIDSSEAIVDVGLGLKKGRFDLSVEAIGFEEGFFLFLYDEETYLVTELRIAANEVLSFYLDYSNADLAESSVFIGGFDYAINQAFKVQCEYASDSFDDSDLDLDVDSIELRFAMKF